MSDNSFWETKYLNSEKSIEFLRQTHADVLKGLHDEIDTLQKQCSEYALKLSLQAPTAIEREEYEKKFKSFNSEYKKKDALIAEQRKLIEDRNRSVKSLEERIKSLEKRQEVEMASKDQMIEKLRQQLENQSLQIANLTFQMHHLNKNVIAKLSQSTTISGNGSGSAHPDLVTTPATTTATTTTSKPLSPKLLAKSSNRASSFIQTSSSSSALNHVGREKVIQADPTMYYSQPKLNLAPQHSNRVKISIENLDNVHNNATHNAESVSSHSNMSSARSDRSGSERMVTKILPPVIMSHRHLAAAAAAAQQAAAAGQHHNYQHHPTSLSTVITTSGQNMPFFNSTQSTLHSRVVKKLSSGSGNNTERNPVDILHRRTLITLPPIQKASVSGGSGGGVNAVDVIGGQLAVESPLKLTNANAASAHNQNNATQ